MVAKNKTRWLELYLSGFSTYGVAKEVGEKPENVRYFLKKRGVLRTKEEARAVASEKGRYASAQSAYSHSHLLKRFHSSYTVNEDTGCWEWHKQKRRGGYGVIEVRGKRKGAHRFSWELARGEIPVIDKNNETCVLHKCDNPACVNPDHLFLGTRMDNNKDRMKKGRHNSGPLKGQGHPCSKLTEAQVREIYLSTMGQGAMASMYGVAPGTVQRIREGTTWRHVTKDLQRPR